MNCWCIYLICVAAMLQELIYYLLRSKSTTCSSCKSDRWVHWRYKPENQHQGKLHAQIHDIVQYIKNDNTIDDNWKYIHV